ncbi:hypothetical cytosolic protein [Renibacterium salmoninarum ATCC 33209]|uniref:Pyridoxal phosphate homeostasis protein n=1 Tax=Renibacterium salmoninarum (strain ATCC 33209 / DSM 20767 / JCM 11484 / NBRC 15589 / NCIMB 2235) TaxID=288705 RepID=A9WRD3_RENSM|nr:YggS family pyridoxal phosphate-dependent enzyme [Renibacterium salmoninarum]ABY24215.1 hypothetical cytosolic protein [Renibacterium salmoninarum ATCC 33209]
MTSEARRRELGANLDAVKQRIAVAVSASGRVDTPQLIVVTKFHPAADVALLADLGVMEVGENRDQEAAAKQAELARAGIDLHWHFIGQLQTNKAKSVARYAYSVHSVDRPALVQALAKAVTAELAAGHRSTTLGCLVQVDLDPLELVPGSSPRGGARPHEVLAIADEIVAADSLELLGVMAVTPLGADPDEAFSRLATISAELVNRHPAAKAISAGMSGDLAAAIKHGATHLRVGSDVLGPRPAVR